MNRHTLLYIVLAVAVVVLMAANVLLGAVDIPPGDAVAIMMGQGRGHEAWRFILLESRLPQMLTAMLSGAALSVSGLLLQTCFRNALAGPDVFGISAGASLGVAVVMLLLGGTVSVGMLAWTGYVAVVAAAFVGAMAVTAVLYLCSRVVSSGVLLLIIGLMVGYLASSAVTLLNFFSTAQGVQQFAVWGMGTFAGVPLAQLPWLAVPVVVALMATVWLVKPLDALLLGDQYADALGVDVVRTRRTALLVTGVLTAVATAFCGPVAFIGLAVPHMARLLLGTSLHARLLPATLLGGAAIALLCNLLTVLPLHGGLLPLNAITPLFGAPVVVYVVLRGRTGA